MAGNHLHAKHAKGEPSALKTRAARVAKEISGLERLLPLTESSGERGTAFQAWESEG